MIIPPELLAVHVESMNSTRRHCSLFGICDLLQNVTRWENLLQNVTRWENLLQNVTCYKM